MPGHDDIMSFFDAFRGYRNLNRQIDRRERNRDNFFDMVRQAGLDAGDMSRFKGFNVYDSFGGGTTVDDLGGLSMMLGEDQANLANENFALAQDFLSNLGGDRAEREQNLFDRIRGLQLEEEALGRSDLEQKLLAEGRLGKSINTDQLDFNDRVNRRRESAALAAIQGIGDEDARNLSLGLGLLGGAYIPQDKQLELLGASAPFAGLSQSGRERAGSLFGNLIEKGLFDENFGYGAQQEKFLDLMKKKDNKRKSFLSSLADSLIGSFF